jgi:hypothetical protein
MAEGIKQSDRTIVRMAIANIHPDPVQPRLHPDAELADSIRSQGILQPFSVEPIQDVDAICPDCGETFASSSHSAINSCSTMASVAGAVRSRRD